MKTIVSAVLAIVAALGIIALMCVLYGLITMWLWNYTVVSMFGAPVLTFWKAWALTVLVGVVGSAFKGAITINSNKE